MSCKGGRWEYPQGNKKLMITWISLKSNQYNNAHLIKCK